MEWVSRKVLRRGNNKKKIFNVPYCFGTSYLTFSRGNSARNAINLFTIWRGRKKTSENFILAFVMCVPFRGSGGFMAI